MRPSIDVYMMSLALMASSRATCSRRSVGCILTDHHNFVIATGYNGVPKGMAHCGEAICPGMRSVSGTNLDGCMAIHAEQNALLQVKDTQSVAVAYCTTQPCLTCTKLLMNTSCYRIVYLQKYSHQLAEDIWIGSGRQIEQLSKDDLTTLKMLFRAQSDALSAL